MCRLYIDLLNRAIVHVCKLRPLQAKTLLASNRIDHGFRQKLLHSYFLMRMSKHWLARNRVKCVLVERNVYPRTGVSVGKDCNHVGVVQYGHHHHHLIECNLFSP